jgi:hypothetical protein
MVMINTSIIIFIIIILTINIYESLCSSSTEYCKSNTCDNDENEFDSKLKDEEAGKSALIFIFFK